MGPRKKFWNLEAWLEMAWLFGNLHSKSLSPNAAKHPHRQHPKPKKSNSPKNKIKSAKTPSSPQPPTKSMKQTWLEPQYKSNSPPPPPPPPLPPPTLSTNLNEYNGYQPSNKESQHSEQEWNNHAEHYNRKEHRYR